MKLFKPTTIWLPTWQGWIVVFIICLGCLLVVVLNVHGFLAPTSRVVKADFLIVEAWAPEVVMRTTAMEFQGGGYRFLVIPDLRKSDEEDSRSRTGGKSPAVDRMVALGVPRDRIIECFAPVTENSRSVSMAGSVRDALRQNGLEPKGMNIMAPAAHARKTWLVYRRALASQAPVGIVAVPTGDYDPKRWWKSTAGAKWVIANGVGWLYELIAGS